MSAQVIKPVPAQPSERRAFEGDVWIYRIVVLTLSLAVLVSLTAGIILTLNEKGTPDAVIVIGSAAVGVMAGLLAPSPMNRR
jgi:hypothetical protein